MVRFKVPLHHNNHHGKKATISASCLIDPDSRISERTGCLGAVPQISRDKGLKAMTGTFEFLAKILTDEKFETSCWIGFSSSPL